MITFFSGKPGAGKSYEAVTKIIENLKKGRQIYTNIEGLEFAVSYSFWPRLDDSKLLVFEKCKLAMIALTGLDEDKLKSQLHFLTKEDVYNFWAIAEPGALIVIDEVHKWFSSRLWQSDKNQELANWASTHRHYGFDVLFITQKVSKVDSHVRSLAEWTYLYRKVNFLGGGIKKKYLQYSFDGEDDEGTPLAKTIKTYDTNVFKCYKSFDTAAAKEMGFMKNVNILKHPVFYAIPVMLCVVLYMFFYKSSFASGDVFMTSKVQHKFEANKVPPVPPAALPGSVLVAAPSPVPVQVAAVGLVPARSVPVVKSVPVVIPKMLPVRSVKLLPVPESKTVTFRCSGYISINNSEFVRVGSRLVPLTVGMVYDADESTITISREAQKLLKFKNFPVVSPVDVVQSRVSSSSKVVVAAITPE